MVNQKQGLLETVDYLINYNVQVIPLTIIYVHTNFYILTIVILSHASKTFLHIVVKTGCLHQIHLVFYIRVVRDLKIFQLLLQYIDILMDCSIVWQLKFNIIKCNVLHLCQPHGYSEYLIDGTTTYII